MDQFDQDSRECALQTSANPTEASLGIVNDKAYRVGLEARQWVRTKQFTLPRPAPTADSTSTLALLDDLIRALQERLRDRQAESLRGLEVDDQLECGRLLDG
jgi:hypothetical protein